MGESAGGASTTDRDAPSDAATPATAKTPDGRTVVLVAAEGDIVLDVTFETSKATIKKSLNAAAIAAARRPKSAAQASGSPSPRLQVAYRVRLDVLKKQSKYFANLLSNPQFNETRTILETHKKLLDMKIKPGEATAESLPWICITDDDEATKSAGRESAFEDMLRIIHQLPPRATRAVMSYVTTLAIIADRFDCSSTVSRAVNTDLKFKWPATMSRPLVDEHGRNTEAEQVMRQKVLVSWLLGQPMRLHQSTRELIVRGSRLWSPYHETEAGASASWWNLPDGLEDELLFRRECILNTIASVQRHFIALYSSKARQCKLGYDSSAACDQFQLGQMIQFLVAKNLLVLIDYSPAALEAFPDASRLNIEELLVTLRQCPNYQIDKHHTNCGLRIRIEPILDYLRAMLSSNVISIPYGEWKRDPAGISWASGIVDEGDKEDKKPKFTFTRAVASDQRLRYEGALYADKMARALFTAGAWDWTPEY